MIKLFPRWLWRVYSRSTKRWSFLLLSYSHMICLPLREFVRRSFGRCCLFNIILSLSLICQKMFINKTFNLSTSNQDDLNSKPKSSWSLRATPKALMGKNAEHWGFSLELSSAHFSEFTTKPLFSLRQYTGISNLASMDARHRERELCFPSLVSVRERAGSRLHCWLWWMSSWAWWV